MVAHRRPRGWVSEDSDRREQRAESRKRDDGVHDDDGRGRELLAIVERREEETAERRDDEQSERERGPLKPWMTVTSTSTIPAAPSAAWSRDSAHGASFPRSTCAARTMPPRAAMAKTTAATFNSMNLSS